MLSDERGMGPELESQEDDMRSSIVHWLEELNPKQREVLARRFGLLGYEPATLEDVGAEIGLTRERVRQIQVEGLRRLREILLGQGLSIEGVVPHQLNGYEYRHQDEKGAAGPLSLSWIVRITPDPECPAASAARP